MKRFFRTNASVIAWLGRKKDFILLRPIYSRSSESEDKKVSITKMNLKKCNLRDYTVVIMVLQIPTVFAEFSRLRAAFPSS